MTNKEERSIWRKRVKHIVGTYGTNNAIKMLIDEEFCISKAEAKRVWYQMRDKK
jgi:nitrate/TMAO reductase-like tetraheme cytochrome c subunit